MEFNTLVKKMESDTLELYRCMNIKKADFGMDLTRLIDHIRIDEIKGIPFLIKNKNLMATVKILPISTNEYHDNSTIEIILNKLFTEEILTKFVSPCIPYYHMSYVETSNKNKCFKRVPFGEINKYNAVKDVSNVLVTEYAKHKDLFTWEENLPELLTDDQWRVLIFQIVYTLSVLQDRYEFVHNDLSPSNILVTDNHNVNSKFKFIYKNNMFVTKCFVILKLWDFEFSNLHNKTYNVDNNCSFDLDEKSKFNNYKDIHFFLNSLLTLELPNETFDFITSLYPETLLIDLASPHYEEGSILPDDPIFSYNEQLKCGVGEKFKLLKTEEILLKHKYFDKLRCNVMDNEIIDATFEYK